MVLKNVFFSTFDTITTNTLHIEECFIFLKKSYSHRSRHYHNLEHLQFMFKELENSQTCPLCKNELVLSIFYHDIVYDATRKDNECKSAQVLEKHLSKTSFDNIQLCKDQIIATQHHEKSLIDPDTNLLIDLDLSILGQDKTTCKSYTGKVRKEYKMYPTFLYKPARKKAMLKFLEQDSIFKTEEFINKYESKARENITKEIKSL
jgi:predicted metal-dependent HD superfamily phosphohydrolase